MKIFIKGNFKRSIYKSDKGYIIGLFKMKETNDKELNDYIDKTITITGYFHELTEEDLYIMYGEILNHPKYGFQFTVSEYEKVKPEDKDGLIEFLASDLFPGVGEKLASSIIDTLGLDALNMITNDQNVLYLVPKITSKKAVSIYNNLLKYNESSTTIIYLTELGFNMKDAMTIYNYYKNDAKKLLENNIYQIIDLIDDISFNKVDEIALKNNIKKDDINRIKAAIIYVIKAVVFSNGDTYLEYSTIMNSLSNYLKFIIDNDLFDNCLYELEKEKKIVKYNDYYYLIDLWKAEEMVANKIIKLASKENKHYTKIDNYIENLELSNDIKYNDKQKEAIKKALENNILIITGGPGTGKTTIIKAITSLYADLNRLSFDQLNDKLSLLAPTGRASKRISESTNLPASTIHRFLKWNKETNKFAVDEFSKDKSSFIIIDEVSMIDISLLDSLLKGLTDDIQLILVGDYNQLPSVGPGQVLKDLIDSEVIDTVHLDLLYRQEENSYINKLAIEVKDNDLSENFLDTKSDYTFLQCPPSQIKDSLKNICKQVIDKGYDYRRVQLMAPMYHGENGIDNLNISLQEIFNPKSKTKEEITYGDVIYRENDKVLQLVNMPDLNVFNGDIGIIKKITNQQNSQSGKNEIEIDFDGNVVKYTTKEFSKFKHGYIISIHKAQGSEFEVVILPICSGYKRMLYRKLIYTAITRAKKKLIIVGEPSAFTYCVSNGNEYIRNTSLLDKIADILYETNKKKKKKSS